MRILSCTIRSCINSHPRLRTCDRKSRNTNKELVSWVQLSVLIQSVQVSLSFLMKGKVRYDVCFATKTFVPITWKVRRFDANAKTTQNQHKNENFNFPDC
eukprot:PhF_6_TR10978/c0_g2_i10/m.17739